MRPDPWRAPLAGVALLGVVLLLGGCTATRLSGRVVDEAKKPLVSVAVETDPPTDFISTSYDGGFAIVRVISQTEARPLKGGAYKVTFKRMGYQEKVVSVDLHDGHVTELGDVVLKHKEIDPMTVDPVEPSKDAGPKSGGVDLSAPKTGI